MPTPATGTREDMSSADTDQGYTLRYGPAATAHVKASLHLAVRPHLQDVRAMLRLPLPEAGITAGCNFAAVHVLLNVLSGLSRLMGRSHKNSGKAFETFVRRWYPWRLEPRPSPYRQKRGTTVLYASFRNGFAHDLGLMLETTSVDARDRLTSRFRTAGPQLGVAKQPSLTSPQLLELDDVSARPAWVGSTIVREGGSRLLVNAVALYWGVRRLLYDHTSSGPALRPLQRMIADGWADARASGRVDRIEAKESGALLFNGQPVTPEELGRRLKRGRAR